ncbi:MAG: hypothetical protein HY073_04205 [Deltaproteobacteria bacterium]|nr:hypothetical protein [Deltaproteobacteria bacterium]
MGVKVTVSKVTSYVDFQEIKAAVLKCEGVKEVSLDSEAPGLLTLQVNSSGDSQALVEKLTLLLDATKFSLELKKLTSGTQELVVSRRL